MQDAELSESVKKKRFLINAFLHTASLPSGSCPDMILKHAVTRHFLQAVTLELLIKMLFELDQQNGAPFTHNLPKLYGKLKKSTRAFIEEKYDDAQKRRRRQFSQIPNIKFHSLDTVLTNNEKTVKNFKYDALAADSNSSVDYVFYNEIFSYIDQRLRELRL